MNENLWSPNHPAAFWRCLSPVLAEEWRDAIRRAAVVLEVPSAAEDVHALLEWTLGEGQFGAERWKLSAAKRVYYLLKPLLPRRLTRVMRRLYGGSKQRHFPLGWPIEDRYARFQWLVLRNILEQRGESTLSFIHFWPDNFRLALVLTHDIETSEGQKFALRVAELEQRLGYRSSFNFVPERYKLDTAIIQELRERGFEIGIHGLKHDGRLFSSRAEFSRRAVKINQYLKSLDAVGFRAPLTHRQPEWMQMLEIEYDLSFFDTDPYEPMPGGTMSIWPFILGRFVELPYTLPQDYTLANILSEQTPDTWLSKTTFLEKYFGMALVNTHPDYLTRSENWKVYMRFLEMLKNRTDFWHALPREVATWWRARIQAETMSELPHSTVSVACLQDDELSILTLLQTGHEHG